MDEALEIFDNMQKTHHISPASTHFACMVDALARAGRFVEAQRFIDMMELMPHKPTDIVWKTLLGASRKYAKQG